MQSKKTQNSTYKICDRKFSPFLPSANTQTRTESPFEAEGHRDRTMVSITSIVAVALTAASTALAGVAAPQSGIIRYKWYRDPECKGIYQALDAGASVGDLKNDAAKGCPVAWTCVFVRACVHTHTRTCTHTRTHTRT